MKTKLAILMLCIVTMLSSTTPVSGIASLSDSAAKARAVTMWGPHASTAKFWAVGAKSTWMFQVGCYDAVNGFLIVGESDVSWERAFSSVAQTKNGTFTIVAHAKRDGVEIATSPIVTVYACNAVVH